MDQFLGQVREARVEQQELRKELNELKRQVENGEEFEVEKDMKALRDDV